MSDQNVFYSNFFQKLKNSVQSVDPVTFCRDNLTLDGHPFDLTMSGYKLFADIYRYIGIISLDSNSKPIVLVKGRQVGASTMSVALELYFMTCGLFGNNGKPPMRILHIFPLLDMARRHAKTKLSTMIAGSILVEDPRYPTRKVPIITTKIDTVKDADSLQYKEFLGGGFIATENAGITGDRIRGYTADACFFDEVQDIRPNAISNTDQILKQAQYGNKGIKVYFGTPKKEGTSYHKMWKMSTQNYYHLGCKGCNKTFPLYTPGSDDWEKEIWIEDDLPFNHKEHGFIVRCPHCKLCQNKKEAADRGKWIPSRPESESEYVGYHINQLFMPNMTRNDILKQKPEFHPINTERLYQNEVLGEFYSGDSSPITSEEIDEKCGDQSLKLAFSLEKSPNRRVYLGCDWGQKIDASQISSEDEEKLANVGKSYSVVVILTVEGPQVLHVKFAFLLAKRDFDYKIQFIEEMYEKFHVDIGIGDIGDAHAETEILQKKLGQRFFASRACPQLISKAKFINEHCPHSGEIQFERNYYIGELLALLKAGKIKFPYGSFDKIGWFVQHCSSMDTKISTDRFGDVKTQYVKGSTPNDGFMALLNAYLAYKYDITNGFKIKDPNRYEQGQVKEKQGIPAVVGYMPKMNPINMDSKNGQQVNLYASRHMR